MHQLLYGVPTPPSEKEIRAGNKIWGYTGDQEGWKGVLAKGTPGNF